MFNYILHKCFRKVRIVNSKKKEGQKSNLLKERNILKKEIKSVKTSEEMKGKIKERIEQIEQKIGTDISKEYYKEIVETLKA